MAFPVPHAASKFRDPYREVAGLAILKIATANLRRLDRHGQPLPDEDGLFYIVQRIAIETEPRGLYPGSSLHRWEPGLSRDQMGDLILRQCRKALRDFRPAQAPFSAAQSRRGGTRSRRTRADLIRQYRALQAELDTTGEVLTRVQIAERLKTRYKGKRHSVSVSTVYRMLAELRPTPVTVLAPPSHILDLLDDEFPETSEFRRHALLKVLDQRPDLRPQPIDWDRLEAEMLADYERIPPIRWGGSSVSNYDFSDAELDRIAEAILGPILHTGPLPWVLKRKFGT